MHQIISHGPSQSPSLDYQTLMKNSCEILNPNKLPVNIILNRSIVMYEWISIDMNRRLFDRQTNWQTEWPINQSTVDITDHIYCYSIFNKISKWHYEWNEIISYQRIHIQQWFDRFWYAMVFCVCFFLFYLSFCPWWDLILLTYG